MILVTGGTGLVGSHLLYSVKFRKMKLLELYIELMKSVEYVKKIFSYFTPKM